MQERVLYSAILRFDIQKSFLLFIHFAFHFKFTAIERTICLLHNNRLKVWVNYYALVDNDALILP